jgi:hypothetical protein
MPPAPRRFRPLAALACAFGLAAATPPAAAASLISQEIAATGLAATEARLAALADPAPAERFALAGLRFLIGIERTLQLRWRHGMNAAMTELPVLRLPVAPNPAPEPFEAAVVTALFEGLAADMAAVHAALAPLPETEFALEVRLGDLWFDIDGNGRRDPGEGVIEVGGMALMGSNLGWRDPAAPPPGEVTVRFDRADAAWLSAYAHLLSGFAKLALAFRPEAPVADVVRSSRALTALAAGAPPANALDHLFGRQADRLMMIVRALEQEPDPALTRAARDHWLAMVADNRAFWRLIEAETDNAAEWVPNERQDAALGFVLPRGTAAAWLEVLADIEAALMGRKLIPHWRLGSGAGINLARWAENPAPVRIAEYAHGMGLIDYAEKGERLSPASWRAFERLLRGDAVLFAVLFN